MSDTRATIRRGFVNVPAGQMHYRMAGEGGERPFVMLHSNPGSSAMLLPLYLTGVIAGVWAWVLAPVFLGTWLGAKLRRRLAPELFRRIVLTLLIVLGCVLIAKALT